MIHVGNYASLVLFDQLPVGKAGKAQIKSAISITTHVLSEWYNSRGIFTTSLTGITTFTAKMTPTMTIAHAGLTTTWISTDWAWAKLGLGFSYVVFFVLTLRRHFQ
jgi:hypothetical protein